MSWLLGLAAKAKFYLAAAGAFIVALAFAFLKGRADGNRAAKVEQAKAREQLQEKYDAIDRKPADVDAAYDRLGRMSDKRGR